MLIYGVANPQGEHGNYNGLYLRDVEINDMVKNRSLIGKPVKIEHKGVDVGKIVSAFKDEQGQLVCVLEIEDNEIEGAVARRWVQDGTIKDLSLGYLVNVDKKDDRLKAVGKEVMEVSLVKKGARERCHILRDEENWKVGHNVDVKREEKDPEKVDGPKKPIDQEEKRQAAEPLPLDELPPVEPPAHCPATEQGAHHEIHEPDLKRQRVDSMNDWKCQQGVLIGDWWGGWFQGFPGAVARRRDRRARGAGMSKYFETECEVEGKKKARKRLKRKIVESDSEEDDDVDTCRGDIPEDAGDAEPGDDGGDMGDPDDQDPQCGEHASAEFLSESESGCSSEISEHESDREFIDDGDPYARDGESADALDALEDECDKADRARKRQDLRLSKRERELQRLEDEELEDDDEFETVKALKMVRKMAQMAKLKHDRRGDLAASTGMRKRSAADMERSRKSGVTILDLFRVKSDLAKSDLAKVNKESSSLGRMQNADMAERQKKETKACTNDDWDKLFQSLEKKDVQTKKVEEKRGEGKDMVKVEIDVSQEFGFIQRSKEREREAALKRNTELLEPLLNRERERVKKRLERPMVKKKVENKPDKDDVQKAGKHVPKCKAITQFFMKK
eukprot:767551-Hanusia_phi.AAC.4